MFQGCFNQNHMKIKDTMGTLQLAPAGTVSLASDVSLWNRSHWSQAAVTEALPALPGTMPDS